MTGDPAADPTGAAPGPAGDEGPGTLAVVAGGGPLPRRLIDACRAQGRPVFVLAFTGHTDAETVAGVDHVWARLGQAGSLLDRVVDRGIHEMVWVGRFRRPALGELRPDWATARSLPRLGLGRLGDDAVMRRIAAILAERDIRLIGVQDVLADDVAPPGPLTRAAPDAQARADGDRALAVARAIGRLDAGQGAVVQQGIVLAVEAAEGTDAMLERCAGLARAGPGGVLAKARKPEQDSRIDLPTVGVTTVENAAAAGLRGIVVEAGAGLIVDRAAVAAAADRLGLFVLAIPPGEDIDAPAGTDP
jgi:hypothetical protein